MTWDLSDTEAIATITAWDHPPYNMNEMLADAAWAHVFDVWANDRAQTATGDTRVWCQFYTDCKKPLEYDELETKYFSEDATETLPYDQMLRRTWFDRDKSPYLIQSQLAHIAAQHFDAEDLGEFDLWEDIRDVAKTAVSDPQALADAVEEAEFQATTVSSPQKVALTRDRIDQAVVDATNQDALKNLQPKTNPISFRMAGDLLLIGDNHQRPYVEFAQKNGGNDKGRLAMKSKGGAFGPGEVLVQRAPWLVEAELEAAIKRLSQKNVTFQDVIPDVI
jgi:hypothetical protein